MILPQPNPLLDGLYRAPEGPDYRRGLVPLDRNERVPPFPPVIFRAMLDSLDPECLASYPDAWPLYERLSASLKLPIDRLLLTHGSDGGVKAAFHAYLRPGDGVVMLTPSYAMYSVYTRMFGGQEYPIAFKEDLSLDYGALVDAIRPGVGLAILANPNQPTGTLMPDGTLRSVLERASSMGTLVLVDEAYFPFSGCTALPLVADYPHLVVLRTFSKAAGLAGLRVGYAVSQPEVISTLYRVHGAYDVNGVAIRLACYLLDHPDIVQEYVAEVQQGGELLAAGAERLGVEALPTHTNFLLLRVGPRHEPAALVEGLRRRGFMVKGPFHEPCLRDCIRVTLGSAAIMQRFLDALASVLADAAPVQTVQ